MTNVKTGLPITLMLDGAFPDEQALRDMIAARKVCFDHDPLYVKDGSERMTQVGFLLNLYAAFQDPGHLPSGEDPELRELVGNLRGLCRVFFQSLDVLKPCRYPEAPMHRVVYAPERAHRAEVCLQIPIVDRAHYGAKPDRRLEELLAAVECLLGRLGARRGRWEDNVPSSPRGPADCAAHLDAAKESAPAD